MIGPLAASASSWSLREHLYFIPLFKSLATGYTTGCPAVEDHSSTRSRATARSWGGIYITLSLGRSSLGIPTFIRDHPNLQAHQQLLVCATASATGCQSARAQIAG